MGGKIYDKAIQRTARMLGNYRPSVIVFISTGNSYKSIQFTYLLIVSRVKILQQKVIDVGKQKQESHAIAGKPRDAAVNSDRYRVRWHFAGAISVSRMQSVSGYDTIRYDRRV